MQIRWDKAIELRVDKTLRYVYFMDRDHPLANSQGKVYYHRHIASLAIGRWVSPDEDVHHRDEDRQNNAPENLEVLSRGEHSHRHNPSLPDAICSRCEKVFRPSHGRVSYCSPHCWNSANRRFDPSKDELAQMVWKMPATAVAELLGVSPSAVQKRCRALGIAKPGRGYWAQQRSNHGPVA